MSPDRKIALLGIVLVVGCRVYEEKLLGPEAEEPPAAGEGAGRSGAAAMSGGVAGAAAVSGGASGASTAGTDAASGGGASSGGVAGGAAEAGGGGSGAGGAASRGVGAAGAGAGAAGAPAGGAGTSDAGSGGAGSGGAGSGGAPAAGSGGAGSGGAGSGGTPAAGSGGTGGGSSVECDEPGGAIWSANGHCYYPLSGSASWNVSRDNCTRDGARLVTITSAAEQAFVETLVGASSRWTGLNRIGASSFSWLGGEAVSYTNWASGEPDQSGEAAAVIEAGSLQWTDDTVSHGHTAICERQ